MEVSKLAGILKERYKSSEKGKTVVSIYLFGIEFAQELDSVSLEEICIHAGIPKTYKTELSKAVRLSDYVVLK